MLAGDPRRVAALRAALHRLGDPDQALHLIHIAGTNGKGSTGAFLAQALANAGYHVGHFASPPLGDPRNQTQRDGMAIPAAAYVEVLTHCQTVLGVTGAAFTTFEWDVLVALQWFAQTHTDWVGA